MFQKLLGPFIKFKAVKFVSTPEDWSTASTMLIIKPDGRTWLITVEAMFPESRTSLIARDDDRREMQEVCNFLRNRVNLFPWNWWLNYRMCTDTYASIFYKT